MVRRLLSGTRGRFESRTEVWREVGLGSEIDRREAHRARRLALACVLGIAAVIFLYSERKDLFPGYGLHVRIATVALLILLGLGFARSLGRSIGPALYRRLEPGAAGTIGFLLRLLAMVVVVVVALRIAGLNPAAIAVGGAFTAVVVGLAAQQTLSNLIAGTVLITTRPFRVGERVRLQGGFLAGSVEGVVGNLGLFYTTLVSGADRIMIPNSGLLLTAISPLREPDRVELRARFGADTTPRQVQEVLEDAVSIPLRYPPHIAVEELDGDEVIVRVVSTPVNPADGAKLAEEVLAGVRRANDLAARNGDRAASHDRTTASHPVHADEGFGGDSG
ncbi:MAG TPA: mechanosensitive ion channel family protein [Solirubrobacterales bacterium]|jgi:small-conductance mechanosensitive channel|nr:mechanosensitive ion channel family protein [Solirubrobacterales bacterium]